MKSLQSKFKSFYEKFKHHIHIGINTLFILSVLYVSYQFLFNNVALNKIVFVIMMLIVVLNAIHDSLESYIEILNKKL